MKTNISLYFISKTLLQFRNFGSNFSPVYFASTRSDRALTIAHFFGFLYTSPVDDVVRVRYMHTTRAVCRRRKTLLPPSTSRVKNNKLFKQSRDIRDGTRKETGRRSQRMQLSTIIIIISHENCIRTRVHEY